MQPPPIRQVILLGASARAAAVSARTAGLAVLAVDRFGDRDLRALCNSWQRLPPKVPPFAYLAQLPRHPLLLLGGCESWLSAFPPLQRHHSLAAASAAQWRQAKDPRVLQELARAASVRFPATWSPADATAPPKARQGASEARWVAKAPFRSGGLGVQWWAGASIDPPSYLQAWIPGVPLGAAYLADGAHCELLGVTAALGRATPTHPALYGGSIGPLSLDDEAAATLHRLGTVVAKRLNLRGLFNIDLVRHPVQGWFLLEINLRYSASMELLESSAADSTTGLSLIGRHLQAFGYRLPSSLARGLDRPAVKGPVRCKRVVYAPAALQMHTRLFERLQRLVRQHRADWADLPIDGNNIAKGARFCTLLTSERSAATTRRRASVVHRALVKALLAASPASRSRF